MASGKASKRKRAAERAQAPPVGRKAPWRASNGRAAGGKVRVPPGATRRTGVDRRVWVAALVAALIAISIVVGVVLAGGDDAPANLNEGATLPDAAEAAALFEGIPQSGLVLGKPDAPVTLVEFIDLQCPFCQQFELETLPPLVEDHVREGTLRVELRGLAFLGPDSERGLRAVLAAGEQNRLYELMELLFYNQGAENSGWLSQDLVEAAARSIPSIDVGRLVADMDSGKVSDLIEEHSAEAERRGVNATPTVLVGPTGGQLKKVDAAPTDIAAIERAITAAQRS